MVGTMNRGGAETMLMELFRNLQDDFHFIFLVNRKKGKQPIGDFDQEIRQLGGEIIYIDAMWDIGIHNYMKEFNSIVKKIGNVDIVHSHLNAKGGVISKAAKRCGIKRIVVHSHARLTFRGSFINIFINNTELFYQKILINKYATDYWACSTEALDSLFYKKNQRSKRSIIINNAINLDKYLSVTHEQVLLKKSELKLPTERLVIGTIGRIAEVKNYDFIIEVLHHLKKRGFPFYFVFAGAKQNGEYSKTIFSKIKEYGLERHVKYLGLQEDLEYIYPLFDVFISPSKKEGLGMVAIEAQASGVPCLLSKGYPSKVDLGLGLVDFFESFHPDTWADAISKGKFYKLDDKNRIGAALRENGFDVNNESQKVKQLYIEGGVS